MAAVLLNEFVPAVADSALCAVYLCFDSVNAWAPSAMPSGGQYSQVC